MSGTDHKHPCMFNMPVSQVQPNRYVELNEKILEELKQELSDDEDIWRLDMLTWVLFQSGDFEKSLKFNDLAVEKSQNRNFVSIANRIHVLKKLGKEDSPETLNYIELLNTMSQNKDNLLEAKAQQGYGCLRQGGATNLQKAIDIFQEIINDLEGPKKYLSRFYLGLSYRRLVHPNTLSCTQSPVNLEEYVKTAVQWFYEVIEESNNSFLKAQAYSELVILYNDASSIFGTTECMAWRKDNSIESLCDKALESSENNAKVLISCGRILCLGNETNVRRGVDLLTKAILKKRSTTGYHHLGLGFIRLAEVERNTNLSHASLNKRDMHYPDDPLIKRAIDCLRMSIKLSANYNLPAILDLGKLLMSTGKLEEGLIEFNKVVESDTRKDGCFFLVIESLEQAGLCLLEMQEKEKDPKMKNEWMSKAEQKLVLAVGLQTQLVNTVSALKHLSEKVWQAFRTLKKRYECDKKSPIMIQKLVSLLGVALEHKEVLRVIKTLSTDDIITTEMAEIALKSYLAEREFTKAFGFLNMLNTLPTPVTIDADLALQVKLNLAESLMTSGDSNPRYVLKTLFDQQYAHSKTKDIDVLIMYDESHDTETAKSHVTEIANMLNIIFSHIFGLETHVNLNNSAIFKCEMSTQLEEMKNSKLVFLLLGYEKLESYFEAILEYVPDVKSSPKTNQDQKTSVVVSSVDSSVEVPDVLSICKHICLKNILQLQRHPEISEKTHFKCNPNQCLESGIADLNLSKVSRIVESTGQAFQWCDLETVDGGADQVSRFSWKDLTTSDSTCVEEVHKDQKSTNNFQQNITSSTKFHVKKWLPGQISESEAKKLIELFEFILMPDNKHVN